MANLRSVTKTSIRERPVRRSRRQSGPLRALAFLLAVLVLAVLITESLALGSRTLSPEEVWQGLLAHDNSVASKVVWELRIHRTVLAVVVGASLAVAGVVARWRAIVGDQVAEHCTIESFDAGRITLRASSSSWAQQLRLLQPTIEARIVEALRSGPGGRQAGGISTGDAVELRILGPAGPTWKRRGVGLRGTRGPRDTYG